MEPFPKRQRLYAPLERAFPESFDDQHTYHDELGDDFIDDEEEYDEEEEQDPEMGSDPELELQQRRAQLDHKLKSTFESIFEKYERDFDGIGDEIDLATGEIVVNNGHILDMMDERDAGDISGVRETLRGYTEELDDLPSSSFDDTEIMEDYDDDEGDAVSDEDMMEDDLILRGFSKANRFPQASLDMVAPVAQVVAREERRRDIAHQETEALPSRADILAQFGPQLGPQILDYVSKQNIRNESKSSQHVPRPFKATTARNVESAWRVPALPSEAPLRSVESAWQVPELPAARAPARPAKQPMSNHQFHPTEDLRSPSPEASASIWAPTRPRGRRRLDGADSNAIFRGESRAPNQHYRPPAERSAYRSSVPSQHRPGDSGLINPHNIASQRNQALNITAQRSPSSAPKYRRLKFTDEEDRMLLQWVSDVRLQGLAMTNSNWKELANEYTRHSWKTWRQRYFNKFTYLAADQTDDPELATSDVDAEYMSNRLPAVPHPLMQVSNAISPEGLRRPTRIRKPAQTETNILTWTEAVDAIESLDPDLHAGILEDASKANEYNMQSKLAASSLPSRNSHLTQEKHDVPWRSREPLHLPDKACIVPESSSIRSSPAIEPTPLQEVALIPGAPCPHTDCKLHQSVLYKLQRREQEEVSEMCLHLFRIHHTTPFPCGEIGCARKGEDGYFMQYDLVKHVRMAHKGLAALQRLRGRVDSALLDEQALVAHPRHGQSHQDVATGEARDSDFMSPKKAQLVRDPSSSRPLSSGFDEDRAPQGFMGMSTFTPTTSVSSLKVHHASAISLQTRDVGKSRDYIVDDSQADSSSRFEQSSQLGVDIQSPQLQSQDSSRSLLREGGSNAIPTQLANSSNNAQNILPPTPETSMNAFDGSTNVSISASRIAARRDLNNQPRKADMPLAEILATNNAGFISSPSESISPVAYHRHMSTSDRVPMNLPPAAMERNVSRLAPQTSIHQLPKTSRRLLSSPSATSVGHGRQNVTSQTKSRQSLKDSNEVPASSNAASTGNLNVKPTSMTGSFIRHTVDPAYDFSDEEDHARPHVAAPVPVTSAQKQKPKQRAKAPLVTPCVKATIIATSSPVANSTDRPTFRPQAGKMPVIKEALLNKSIATPVAGPQARKEITAAKSVGHAVIGKPPAANRVPRPLSEGVDELSLGAADFVMLSTRRAAKPLPIPQIGIKHEDIAGTPNLKSVPAARKRKADTLHDNDFDELSVIGTSTLLSSVPKPAIKIETDDTSIQSRPKMPLPKRRRRTLAEIDKASNESSSSQPPPTLPERNDAAGTATPLLDLTPARNARINAERTKEIGDSEAETPDLESPTQRTRQYIRGMTARPGQHGGDITPTAKRRWNRDLLMAEQVVVVVKTPGGTMRRCGEGGFECRKSFCFRCRGE